MARNAHVKLGDFEKRYQFVGVEATPGYRLESTADLQSYLDLLLTDQSALDGLRAMTAVVKGAEAAILDGERDHGRVEDREIAALKSLPK